MPQLARSPRRMRIRHSGTAYQPMGVYAGGTSRFERLQARKRRRRTRVAVVLGVLAAVLIATGSPAF